MNFSMFWGRAVKGCNIALHLWGQAVKGCNIALHLWGRAVKGGNTALCLWGRAVKGCNIALHLWGWAVKGCDIAQWKWREWNHLMYSKLGFKGALGVIFEVFLYLRFYLRYCHEILHTYRCLPLQLSQWIWNTRGQLERCYSNISSELTIKTGTLLPHL